MATDKAENPKPQPWPFVAEWLKIRESTRNPQTWGQRGVAPPAAGPPQAVSGKIPRGKKQRS